MAGGTVEGTVVIGGCTAYGWPASMEACGVMDENPCPVCGGKMVSRLNKAKQQRFWGCADFPRCKGTRDTDGLSRAEKQRDSDESWHERND